MAMNAKKRIMEHRAFVHKEKEKKDKRRKLITFLNKQQEIMFGEVINPVKEEELL